MNGFLLLDKPQGLTSARVVGKVRRALGKAKTGHCGTLDELATGLLIICLGKATKLAQFVIGEDKSYDVTVRLGATSTTFDRDGELTPVPTAEAPTRAELESAIGTFIGKITQQPPTYSAIKHLGRPLYDYARKGKPVAAELREVVVHNLEILNYRYPELKLQVHCSSGTYVRSLAHDLGAALGCGAYVVELRRLSIGRHHVKNAITLASILEGAERAEDGCFPLGQVAEPTFVPTEKMLDFPTLYVEPGRESAIDHGVPIRGSDVVLAAGTKVNARDIVMLYAREGRLIAVGRSLFAGSELRQHPTEPVVEYVRVLS